jgi:integrase
MKTAKAWVRLDKRTADLPRASRRWVVDYQDALTMRSRTKGGFRTKGAAQAWATGYVTDCARGTYQAPDTDRTFSTAARQWLSAQADLKQRTRQSYESLLFGPRSRLATTFGPAPTANIRREDVQAFVRGMQGAGLQASTVRNTITLLRAVLGEEVHARRLPYNAALGVDLPSVKRPADYDKVRYDLQPGDLDMIVASLPWPYDVLALTAAWTGLRAGELAGLQVGDLDLSRKTVSVKRVIIDVNGRLATDVPKTSSSVRLVSIEAIATDLARHVDRLSREARAWFPANSQLHPGDLALPLFPGLMTGRRQADGLPRLDYGKPLRHSAWYGRYWKQALRLAGIPESVRFHDLRHADATWMLNDGVPLKDIQDSLGHSSDSTSLRYAHRNNDDRLKVTGKSLAGRRAATAVAKGNVIPLRRVR